MDSKYEDRMNEYLKVEMKVPTVDELRRAVASGTIKPESDIPPYRAFAKRTLAQRVCEDMGLGFNLGNTFDAVVRDDSVFKGVEIETAWHNPKTTREMIKALRKGGFKTMRLPVSWHNHVSGSDDYIDPAWMKRVKEVVSWCLAEDMYVILNTHHDILPGYIYPDTENMKRSCDFMKNVWTQIAESFKDVSADKLVFESMNEVRVFTNFEWTPDYDNEDCVIAMNNINRLNQLFVDAVRSSGSRNAERCLVIPGYATSTEGACWDGFKLPKDTVPGRMIVAAHVYSPAHFAFFLKEGANILTFDLNDPESRNPIDERLTKLYDKFVANGIPVTIDEFGTVEKDNDPERIKCLAYTVAKATQFKIRCCYWDNGTFFRYGDGMAIFSRKTCSFPRREPLDAMLTGLGSF